MTTYRYIVIAQPVKGAKPRIIFTRADEEAAKAEAHYQLNKTHGDVQVFDLDTWDCVLALTQEPADPP